MPSTLPKPSKAEQRRQHTLERRQQNATEVLGESGTDVVARPQLSFVAQSFLKAVPAELVRNGRITMDQQGQPRVAFYDPALLAPNPQRGRVVDRGLEELAASLDSHGQQEAILARLITDTDRQRWPKAFRPGQLLLILKGHRIWHAQPKTKLTALRVELMLPVDGEDDLAYSRRALRRASIRMMHSQGYDLFDKANLYDVWRQEFAIGKPKDTEVAAYFEISRTEAQRVKTVARLDPDISDKMINSERRPADEVVFIIANRPPEEQAEAYERYGHLTVAAARKMLQQQEGSKPAVPVSSAGRPRNYVFPVRMEESDITYISSSLTPQQWKQKGGAKAFWTAVQALLSRKDVRERLEKDLG